MSRHNGEALANGFINKSLPDTDEMSLACLFGRGFKNIVHCHADGGGHGNDDHILH